MNAEAFIALMWVALVVGLGVGIFAAVITWQH